MTAAGGAADEARTHRDAGAHGRHRAATSPDEPDRPIAPDTPTGSGAPSGSTGPPDPHHPTTPMDAEAALPGGNVSGTVRVGDTVRRTAGPWTPTVHALLGWARARGATMVPAPLGLDDQGREVLAWVPGEAGSWPTPDWVWHPRTVQQAGGLLRTWHDATVDFHLADAVWRLPPSEPAEVICLNDLSPDNLVHAGGRLVAFIDVDMAAPGPRVRDLAYLAYRLCSFCTDLPTPGGLDPLHRLDSLLDAYGRDRAPDRTAVLTTMRDRLHELADWTDRHADRTDRPDLHEHSRMYRHDAAHLPAS